jgi:hypothetical protein
MNSLLPHLPTKNIGSSGYNLINPSITPKTPKLPSNNVDEDEEIQKTYVLEGKRS